MKYRITFKRKDKPDKSYDITAKTDLALRMKIGHLEEKAEIRESVVLQTLTEEMGEDD